MFVKELKCTVQSGELEIVCDFAENYSFTLQDDTQGFHQYNAHSTIHPFIV
jgi:hypothetical protein